MIFFQFLLSFYIEKVIQKTGFKYHFITPNSKQFLKDLDKFIWHKEEPMVGNSYYGEFKLREIIKSHGVTVSLEGQGDDEFISGYESLLLQYFFNLISKLNFCKFIIEYKFQSKLFNNPIKIIRAFLGRNKKLNYKNLKLKYPYLNFLFIKSTYLIH